MEMASTYIKKGKMMQQIGTQWTESTGKRCVGGTIEEMCRGDHRRDV